MLLVVPCYCATLRKYKAKLQYIPPAIFHKLPKGLAILSKDLHGRHNLPCIQSKIRTSLRGGTMNWLEFYARILRYVRILRSSTGS